MTKQNNISQYKNVQYTKCCCFVSEGDAFSPEIVIKYQRHLMRFAVRICLLESNDVYVFCQASKGTMYATMLKPLVFDE